MASLATVDLLARTQLEARRLGFAIALRDVPPDVLELIRLAGLEEVLPVEPRPGAAGRGDGAGAATT